MAIGEEATHLVEGEAMEEEGIGLLGKMTVSSAGAQGTGLGTALQQVVTEVVEAHFLHVLGLEGVVVVGIAT
jgi:hypothetical protein